MTDWTFHPRFVNPFYQHFMSGNIVTLSTEAERAAILHDFCVSAEEITEQQIREMLRATWRPALVAAWYITYLKRTDFLPEVEQKLMRSPSYVQPFCICLARLGGASAITTLLAYIEGCTSGQLQMDKWDETITPACALSALEYLEPNKARSGALWDAFLEKQKLRYENGVASSSHHEHMVHRLMEGWAARRPWSQQVFAKIMDLFDHELQRSQ